MKSNRRYLKKQTRRSKGNRTRRCNKTKRNTKRTRSKHTKRSKRNRVKRSRKMRKQRGSGNGWTIGDESIGGRPRYDRYSNCPSVSPRDPKFAEALY